MPSNGTPLRDGLDDLVNQAFAGKVVRKDLVRKVKVGANVPVFVLEYPPRQVLCVDRSPSIELGLHVVNDTLAENYIRPDESMKAQSTVMDKGHHSFIDKVKVRVSEGRALGRSSELRRPLHAYPDPVPSGLRAPPDRGRLGAGRCQLPVRRGDQGRHSFWISKLEPIQIATFNLEDYRVGRC